MRWISNSTKALLRKVATSILPALLGVGAIYLILSNGFTRRTIESSKAPSDIHAAPVVKDAQDASAGDNDKDERDSGAHRSGSSRSHLRKKLRPSSHPCTCSYSGSLPLHRHPKVSRPTANFSQHSNRLQWPSHRHPRSQQSTLADQQPANDRNKSERQPGEINRKSLERKRVAAERNRARLEKMYQKHRISSDAYKKGEEKYKSEIEEYRSAVNAGKAPRNDS